MASSIEDILMAKAMADAERRETDNIGMALGALTGTSFGAAAAPMRNTSDLKERSLLNARGVNLGRRLAGGLVGAIIGGGLGAGQIIGQSTRQNDAPASEPITTGHLMSTVMHSLFDVGQLRLAQGVPRELLNHVERYAPIQG